MWTDAIASGLQELYNDGITIDQISQTLATIPFNQNTCRLLEYLSSKGVTMMIASDANTFYINEILRNFSIAQYFERIYTNQGAVVDGKLSVSRYISSDACHGCDLCPPNLCKVFKLR